MFGDSLYLPCGKFFYQNRTKMFLTNQRILIYNFLLKKIESIMKNIYLDIEDIVMSMELPPDEKIQISFWLYCDGTVLGEKYAPISNFNNGLFRKIIALAPFGQAPEVAQKLKPYKVKIEIETVNGESILSLKTIYQERHSDNALIISNTLSK